MWKPAARPYRSSNRCCRRISWNDEDSGRNSAPKATANAFPESIRPLRWFMWGNPLHILSKLVGEGREVEARCAVVSLLQSLLSPNFLE
ncbi:hypothetical protein [Paenibacillus lautus]|uniref:hypothetical protein n=1 Tax=Paenibacillus lautus TaxID=1401 RepID=UPI001BCA8D95|nr:hypothetical protein [Paenibacillus lautus]